LKGENEMQLFRGYVESKNKKCIEKFKDRTDLKTFKQVQHLPEFAGILAKDTILIDIDDLEISELIYKIVQELNLKCRVYKTSRGKHFLFKNNGIKTNRTGCKLAIGLTADIKLGSRNSYSILKYDNQVRPILYDSKEYQEVPKWLTPVKSSFEFLDMEPGDGRNQALFNYILTLQSNDFTVEEARETIRLINDYILKVPLKKSELETVLRDDAFKKPIFFKGTSFLFDKFATYIKNNNRIIRINNQLHIYKDGIYVDSLQMIEAEMIKHIPNLNRAKRTEVLSYLNLLVLENTPASDANLIAFKNGIYDLVNDTILPFSPETIITNKIKWDYNPEAYSELVDKTLNKIACGDKQIRQLLEEAVGYCLYRRNELGKAFILIGDQSNGKSTFLDMVKSMLGDENIASLDLGELGDRFKTAELFGKLANIGDDIGDEFIPNAAVFRKLVTGERLSVERKGQDPFEFNNYSKMLFSANNIPRMKDKTGAVQRRLVIIPFDARFTAEDPDFDPYIKYKLRDQECMEYLIKIGLEGLARVLKNQQFTTSDRVIKELTEYEESNNPILGFLQEITLEEVENEPTRDIYKRYQVYCSENNLQALSNIEFSKQVKAKFGFDIVDRKIDGKKYRVFVRG
jgi:putative DNA primase/helicase